MLELGLVQAKATLFKNVLEALSDLFSEAYFDFSGTGCELQALDTSHVALVLHPNAFNRYHCYSNVSMGLNLANIKMLHIITFKLEELIEHTLIQQLLR
ncbi:hypothetical protein U9M48_025885 [Paspalum notatum var. saurae]|uniref:Proliferating cell nuclear antigen PCNA N-terminal domain-containing protein n=1 Tax=Paspalum notatum var. saurae TaxID=547442 RepID=A0AAQ3TRE3_PASNO